VSTSVAGSYSQFHVSKPDLDFLDPCIWCHVSRWKDDIGLSVLLTDANLLLCLMSKPPVFCFDKSWFSYCTVNYVLSVFPTKTDESTVGVTCHLHMHNEKLQKRSCVKFFCRCPSARNDLRTAWTELYEIWYQRVFQKIVNTFQFLDKLWWQ
jgi:hypothetical protein